jgi:uncharacterized membrane protein YkoI
MNRFAIVVVAAALSAGPVGFAYADHREQPGSDWMPAQQVIEKALKSGYTEVSEIKAKQGRWEGEGMKNGQKMEFQADPKTGDIMSEKLD